MDEREETVLAQPSPGGANPVEAREAFAARIFRATVEMMDVLSVYIGDRLGLYAVLHREGPATPRALAERAGIHERYAREWLEQQAVTGILDVDDDHATPDVRRYALPPPHADALIDPSSLYSSAPLGRSVVACANVLPVILEAYRSGGGVPWADYGEDMIRAQGDFNRPWLLAEFATKYLASISDIHARLQADPPARVADVACGVGWASIAIAQGYPKVSVDGFDLDEASIELARRNALDAGVGDRVKFWARDAADPPTPRGYDLAVVIEAVHDLSRPVQVLSSIRGMLAPGGTALVADEKCAESFSTPGDDLERLFYGYSILCCLPTAMIDRPTAGTGTAMRPETLQLYAQQAGFDRVDVLDLGHEMLRFYRLWP